MSAGGIGEEQQQVRALAREFAEAELRPHVERWDRERALDPAVFKQLGELGFFGMLAPEAFGGLDLDLPTYLAALEELAWGEPTIALTLSIHSAFAVTLLLRHGGEALKTRWLERLARGDAVACFALSEAEAGSDAAALTTQAARDGDGWVLSGEKKWVSNGGVAGLALVAARTDSPEARCGAKGIGLFLVPTDAAGYEVGAREKLMGLRPIEVVTLHLRDVRLDGDAVLGDPTRGFVYAMEGLDVGRLGIAAQAVGIAQAALDHALAYAGEREQFGQKIREFQGLQFKLADMATRVAAARALVQQSAASPATAASAMAKLFASETAMWVTTQAVQVFGGYGYMRDYPVEKLMRDAKATEIYEGSNEIQRVVIARELY
ncbi:MAG: acyl-CoA dehydrogenase family protein, partial [Gemmatimonadetes bacterium]|nr:acyl-CoA dehydrogenase family protein [Gemmatimonadota bacterium]